MYLIVLSLCKNIHTYVYVYIFMNMEKMNYGYYEQLNGCKNSIHFMSNKS